MGNPDYKQSSHGMHESLLAWRPSNLGEKVTNGPKIYLARG